ncbi:hypothetical protein FCV43_19515 [Vibrio genomosp. F6]|uniref:hypothetical protein n=1 Tax=Vibrio genomosp. F6 TaxID=723172 RepID=UPI0010BDE67D|nr:hypothetical protein [Vibrio genomosp. F6]TKF14606.1 hypothetical protein FCV43_19515 [Vibrio genomosp. F6]
MRNLDIFNCAALEVMHAGLDKFPVPTDVAPTEIAERVKDYFESNDDGELNSQELFKACYATVKWLEQEGYLIINHETLRESICNVTLTQKGLNALNSIPTFDKSENKSFGQYFIKGIKPISASVVGNLMTDFFRTIS